MKQQERVNGSGEVFTPRSLIREMLDRLPNSVWFDPNKRWLEPSAGDGNFLVEVKARLLQAGHDEVHILENMLFSVELIDDNHWSLQHRLGYLIDGQPNPALDIRNFVLDAEISQLTQDLNDKNPYTTIGCARDRIIHHRNHVCWSALDYDMTFGRTGDEFVEVLEVLPTRDLGAWPETDTPDIGERYIVEKMLGKQPNLSHPEVPMSNQLRHVSYCKVTVSDEQFSRIEKFFGGLPARLEVLKLHVDEPRVQAFISYGPASGANQDDIKRELVKAAEATCIKIESMEWWRTREGEPVPDVQLGTSELPSVRDYVKKHGATEGLKRRKAGLPL